VSDFFARWCLFHLTDSDDAVSGDRLAVTSYCSIDSTEAQLANSLKTVTTSGYSNGISVFVVDFCSKPGVQNGSLSLTALIEHLAEPLTSLDDMARSRGTDLLAQVLQSMVKKNNNNKKKKKKKICFPLTSTLLHSMVVTFQTHNSAFC
jgi:hypothetical protein